MHALLEGVLSEMRHVITHGAPKTVEMLWSEWQKVPPRKATAHVISIHLVGGIGAPPIYYNLTRSGLKDRLGGKISIHIPVEMILTARGGIRSSLLALFGDIETKNSSGEIGGEVILAGHSCGGLVALIALALEPRVVKKVILLGTPLDTARAEHWIVRFSMEHVLGMNLRQYPGILEYVRRALGDEELRSRVEIIASKRDRFCTPDTCVFPGIPEEQIHIFDSPSHTELPHDPHVLDLMAAIVRNTIRLRSVRRIAVSE